MKRAILSLVALAPLGLHLAVLAPMLMAAGRRDIAVVSFVGSMFSVWLLARWLAQPRRERRPYIPAGVTHQGRIDPPPAPAEAVSELVHDDWQPLTGKESLRVWIVMSAPSLGMAALMALILWVTKP